ncbi:unnamed protein product [Fraxinus pennsylvanica]|uniref:HTH myb-type domain-containing protein n=1 Tax=Fraxinus pennsylvanica TaxID=56036 RepID=A0AAD2DQ79_9LAMI|nr:unnamed protein product [Fraxinus pennsylvanica]
MDRREGILDGKCKGICILVVNDDFTCRNIATEMLKHCHHEELYTGQISEAISIMWERKDRFELVLTNAHRLESDEFYIVQCVQNRFNLPTILMSPDKMKIASNGEDYIVSAYVVNSLCRKDINGLWQSAFKKVKANKVEVVAKLEGNSQERSMSYNVVEAENNLSSNSEPTQAQHQLKREEDRNSSEQNEVGKDDSHNKKKPRMVWTREMHQKFLVAIDFLGPEKAVPKKIAERMKVPGLTRENVASHLQKYRDCKKRDHDVSVNSMHDTNTRNLYQGSGYFPSLSVSRFNSLQRNSITVQQGYTTPFHQGSYFLNAKESTSTLNLRQSQLLSANNQRVTRFLNRTVPERNNYTNLGISQQLQQKCTPRVQDKEAYGEINRDNSSTGTNQSTNSNSTYVYVGLRFANDGKSIKSSQHKVSTHNVISTEALVSDLRTTGDELNFNWLGTSTSYIQPNMSSFSSPSTLTDCISLQPSQPETSAYHNPSTLIEGISQQPFLLENLSRDMQQRKFMPILRPSLPRLPANEDDVQHVSTSENSSFHQHPSIPLPQKLQESNDFLTDREMNNIFINGIGTTYPQYTLEDLDDSFFVDDESVR